MKLFHLLTLFLFLLLFVPTSFAESSLLLAPLPLKKMDAEKTNETLKALQFLLEKANWKVVGMSQTASTKTLASALETAMEEQFNFNNKRAIEIINRALSQFETSSPTLTDLQKIADAQLFLAYCHKNEGQTSLMNQALDAAARFNPSLSADEVLFPPSLIQAFETAKDRIWAQGHFGTFMIESHPSRAQVFMNGTFKGRTPLRIDRYPVGTHHLYLQSGSGGAYRKIEIGEGNNSTLRLKLASNKFASSKGGSSAVYLKTFSATDHKGGKKWLEAQAESMHQPRALGVGLIPGKADIRVEVISTGNSKPFTLKIPDTTSAKTIAQTLFRTVTQ